MTATLAITCTLLLAGGCGSSEEPSAKASKSSSPTATQPVARVSLQTACEVLFPGAEDQEPLLSSMLMVVGSDAAPSPVMVDTAVEDLARVKRLAPQAPVKLSGQLDTIVREVEPYFDDLKQTGAGSIDDTTTLKAAGIEVTNLCLSVL